jgi:hypothetical protein
MRALAHAAGYPTKPVTVIMPSHKAGQMIPQLVSLLRSGQASWPQGCLHAQSTHVKIWKKVLLPFYELRTK